jgi:hypothetical protein
MGASGSKAEKEFSRQLLEVQKAYTANKIDGPPAIDQVFAANVQPLFESADKDGNGFLNREECHDLLVDVMKAQIKMCPKFAKDHGAPAEVVDGIKASLEAILNDDDFEGACKRIFTRLDLDQSNQVSLKEFEKEWAHQLAQLTTGATNVDVSKIGKEELEPLDPPGWPGKESEHSDNMFTIEVWWCVEKPTESVCGRDIDVTKDDTIQQIYARFMNKGVKKLLEIAYNIPEMKGVEDREAKAKLMCSKPEERPTWAILVYGTNREMYPVAFNSTLESAGASTSSKLFFTNGDTFDASKHDLHPKGDKTLSAPEVLGDITLGM